MVNANDPIPIPCIGPKGEEGYFYEGMKGFYRFTPDDVRDIRKKWNSTKGMPNRGRGTSKEKWTVGRIAGFYKTNRSAISDIIYRRTYNWVK